MLWQPAQSPDGQQTRNRCCSSLSLSSHTLPSGDRKRRKRRDWRGFGEDLCQLRRTLAKLPASKNRSNVYEKNSTIRPEDKTDFNFSRLNTAVLDLPIHQQGLRGLDEGTIRRKTMNPPPPGKKGGRERRRKSHPCSQGTVVEIEGGWRTVSKCLGASPGPTGFPVQNHPS